MHGPTEIGGWDRTDARAVSRLPTAICCGKIVVTTVKPIQVVSREDYHINTTASEVDQNK
jgi:hypothetical protein